MSIQQILDKLVSRVEESIGAIIVDWEGEAVLESCNCDPYDLRFMAAHKAIILAHFSHVQIKGKSSDLVEIISIMSEKAHILIGAIDKDYALLLYLKSGSNFGAAQYHFKHAVSDLKKEI